MNLQELKHKTILLLGKTRALEKQEFLSQLKHHSIDCTDQYSSEVSFIVEGKMLNHIEQEEMEDLHTNQSASFIHISQLEKALCEEIDSAKLHMSLKLSADEDRLLAFIQNEFITDELFLRLISLHDWRNENFFENDENRDVTAALIKRFYADIEKNHNVQYATTGLLHLIMQTSKPELIEAISNLQPIKKALKDENIENGTFKILQVISLHPLTPASVIKMYIKNATNILKAQVASRNDLSPAFQGFLYKENSELINKTLASNANLDVKIAKELIENTLCADAVSKTTKLDEELFELLAKTHAHFLALNESLSEEMIEKLFSLEDEDVFLSLSLNKSLSENHYKRLYNINSENIYKALSKNTSLPLDMLRDLYKQECTHPALAENISTPKEILEDLFTKENEDILSGLAKNISTPIDILCQLQLDRRYDRYVKENESFGKHITSENIGWL